MPRRIMRSFKLNEISMVDAPAQEGALAMIMKRSGTPFTKADPENQTSGKLFETFAEAVAYIRQRDKVSETKAMSTARKEFPSLVGKLQADCDDMIAKAAEDEQDEDDRRFAANAIQRPFLQKVEAIRTRDNLSRTDAMTKARQECPQEFSEAFGTE